VSLLLRQLGHEKGRQNVKRFLLLGTVLAALTPGAAFAHEGGDAGGCAAQGHWLHDVSRDPATWGAVYGVPDAGNLGDIASFFAPKGVLAGLIETFEHVVFC
jgi:hypothetical protein